MNDSMREDICRGAQRPQRGHPHRHPLHQAVGDPLVGKLVERNGIAVAAAARQRGRDCAAAEGLVRLLEVPGRQQVLEKGQFDEAAVLLGKAVE